MQNQGRCASLSTIKWKPLYHFAIAKSNSGQNDFLPAREGKRGKKRKNDRFIDLFVLPLSSETVTV